MMVKIIIALPVYNEELVLEKNVKQILDFCRDNIQDEFKIVISDNTSSDRTGEIAQGLANNNSEVEYLFLERKGKGLAIYEVWKKYEGDVYCFMDVDLATDLSALPRLVDELKNGNDIVIGSRFHKDSEVERSILRKVFSQGYRMVVKLLFGMKINDVPCGFKGINNQVKKQVLPLVCDRAYFFDSEMLILAVKRGFKAKEIPVKWMESPDPERKSKVNLWDTTVKYFSRAWELKKRLK